MGRSAPSLRCGHSPETWIPTYVQRPLKASTSCGTTWPLLQQRVHRFEVLDVHRAGCLLEQELVEDELVAGLRVVAERRGEVLLGDQHVDDSAGTDFEAGLRGVAGALRRLDGRLGRADLADAGDDGAVEVQRVADH